MFQSKTKKALKQAEKLVRGKNWNEAIALLNELQKSSDLDQSEVTYLLTLAQNGLAQDIINEAKQFIRRSNYKRALHLLESLKEKHSDNEEIDNLILRANEGAIKEKLGIAQGYIRSKNYRNALSILESLDQDNSLSSEIKRLIGAAKDGLKKPRIFDLRTREKVGIGIALFFIVMVAINVISAAQERREREERTEQSRNAAIATQRTATASSRETEIAFWNQATLITFTPTASFTNTLTPTSTLTRTFTMTPTITFTPSLTLTNTFTMTPTTTFTPSLTFTNTSTMTPTATFTSTKTPTPTHTLTLTSTSTATNTPVVGGVINDRTNARICPSVECDLARIVLMSEEFVVLGSYNDWYWLEFEDNTRAFIRGDLMTLPEDAVVGIAPTMTPSFTPTSTRTNTPRPTLTSTPFQFDDALILDLIEATMLISDMPIESIQKQNNLLTVKIEDPGGFEERFGYIGTLVGATVTAYEGENVIATPPQQIVAEFAIGNITIVRYRFSYRDAKNFINGIITAAQFLNTITVE